MDWYKTSQDIKLLQRQGFSEGTAFNKVQRTLKSFGMENAFENISQGKGYECAMDFILCHFITEFDAPCKAYYNSQGAKLIDILSKSELQQIDERLSAILAETLRGS